MSAFDQYCTAYSDAVLAARSDRKPPRRVLLVSAAGAVAAAVAVLLLLAPGPQIKISPVRPTGEASAPIAHQPVSAAQAAQAQDANWTPGGLAVEIAIPGDDMAPPGALPEGVGFTADVMLAPDGSAQRIQVRPQLAEFERRPSRP